MSTPTQDYPIINGFFNSEGIIDPHFGAYPAGIQFGSHTSGSRITQLGGSLTDANHLVFRKKTGDTWGNVHTIYHSGNQLTLGTTASSARTALGLSSVATLAPAGSASTTANQVLLTGYAGLLSGNPQSPWGLEEDLNNRNLWSVSQFH